uniref:SAFB-like transcription modulator n=1 Tax=Parascaris univalens TaxID=6257 RepID=A0A915C6D9_PARUN
MDDSLKEVSSGQGRLVPLSSLKVFELKEELGKRGLDKTGVKVALIERLLMALRNEGHDPETYLFSVTEYAKETSSASSPRLEAASQVEQSTGNDDLGDADEPVAVEEAETVVDEGSQHGDPAMAPNATDVEMCDGSRRGNVEIYDGKGQTVAGKEAKENAVAVMDQVKSEVESTQSSTSIFTAGIQSTKSCSVWVKGISADVKASHLKTLFAQCGRVVSAKIFVRRNQPTNSYVGLVTMISAVCAERCVQLLNKTSYNGDMLIVELANEKKMAYVKQWSVSKCSSAGKGVEGAQASHWSEEGSQVTRCTDADMKDVTERGDGDECADSKEGSAAKEHLERRYHEEIKQQHSASKDAKTEQEESKGAWIKKKGEGVEQHSKKSAVKIEEKESAGQGMRSAQPQLTNALLKSSRSLWIRGIGADTKAAHLKTMFSKCGRVITAKVFVRRQLTSNVYFGFLSMASAESADSCVQQFNKAVLNGQQITVERADHSGMAVRIPEVKKEGKTVDAVVDEEASKSSKEEGAGMSAKTGEKRNSSNLTLNIESKKQFSVKDDSKREGNTKREEHDARHSEKPPTSREFTSTTTSSINERKLARRVFKTHRTAQATRFNNSAIRKPPRSLLTAKAARTSKRMSFGGREAARIAPAAATHRLEKRNYPRRPSHRSANRGTYKRSTPPAHPLFNGEDGGIRGRGKRCFSSATAAADSYRRSCGSPLLSWEEHATVEMLYRKKETSRLQEEERRLHEERDRLRQERARIERERIMLEREKRATFTAGRTRSERVAERHRTRERDRAECGRVTADRECAERERIAVENGEAEREREQIRFQKERVVQERMRIERERERIRVGRLRAEEERLRAERERAERLRREQRERNDRVRVEEERAEQERLRVERERAEREKVAERERLRAEKERAERERLEAERERIKAEKERTERERLRLERERVERERLQLERLRVEAERERLKAEADHERLRGIEGERGQAEFGRHSDRLKTQMERMERERLELEQLRQLAALTASEAISTFVPSPRSSVRESSSRQELDLPSGRHRGAYGQPGERFAPYAARTAVERYLTSSLSPAAASRFGGDREREHSRRDAPRDSYGGNSGVEDVSYNYRTHVSEYDRRCELEPNTTLPLGRDILSVRYNSDRRRDASCPDATHTALFENHVSRTTRDVPAPLTVPYSLQQQGINKDCHGGSPSEATASGYNMSGTWPFSASGVAPGANPYVASECGDTSGGIWSQLSSIPTTQRCAASDSGTWIPPQQGIWIGQQQSTGLTPIDGKISSFGEEGMSSRRLSELKPEASRLAVDDQRRRSLQGTGGRQGKQKMAVGSKNVDRGRSGKKSLWFPHFCFS